ncbi:MAG: hypothetical protein AAF809_00645 [Bacteroidota bacterium]
MLRRILALALLALPVTALAQNAAPAGSAPTVPTTKGGSQFTGTASFASVGGTAFDNDEVGRLNTTIIDLSGGYFVASGVSLGGIFLGRSDNQDGLTISTFGIGPEVTLFLPIGNKDVYPFISAAGLLVNVSAAQDGQSDSINGTAFQVAGGLTYMLTPSVGITVEGYYLGEQVRPDEGDRIETNTLGVRGGLTVFLR